ncbi:MAG: hypothetical protein Q7T66_09290 [Herminiimonas sp.]|uniref:hypothetical protein n=1 Tax=Herminiimonas sp. TaxID=1926289 RepID=UPI0027203AD9|nr:hypothetical protein [Herminiimonas sp.]MDO9420843.1 hypothetical protein [Herminiimonas sp.]
MRRFIVICLIFLFPLQVFADAADYPPVHLVAPDSLSQINFESKFDNAGGITSLINKVCSEDGFDQPPAHLELTDVLIQELVSELAEKIGTIRPACLPLQNNALYLPLLKPPPRL